MNTKSREALFVGEVLARVGVRPWIVDLSMKSHDVPGADVTGAQVAEAAGTSWPELNERSRHEAASVMAEGARHLAVGRLPPLRWRKAADESCWGKWPTARCRARSVSAAQMAPILCAPSSGRCPT